jgi:hypothetical protein
VHIVDFNIVLHNLKKASQPSLNNKLLKRNLDIPDGASLPAVVSTLRDQSNFHGSGNPLELHDLDR